MMRRREGLFLLNHLVDLVGEVPRGGGEGGVGARNYAHSPDLLFRCQPATDMIR
jgi:hypothetical protein